MTPRQAALLARQEAVARARLCQMDQDQLAATTPEALVRSFGLRIDRAQLLLKSFQRRS